MGDILSTHEMRNKYKILVGNVKMRDALGNIGLELKLILKLNRVRRCVMAEWWASVKMRI